MKDAEELYYHLERTVKDLGLDINDHADRALADFCEKMFPGTVAPSEFDRDDDPHWRWQTYSPEMNQRMEEMFTKLAGDLSNGGVTRNTLARAVNDRLNALEAQWPGEGVWDTEPQEELAQRLNPVLDELGYKEVSRWEW